MRSKNLKHQIAMYSIMFVVLIGASTSQATVMKALSLAELVNHSSLIVEGKITRIQSEWTADRRAIVTDVDITHMPDGVLKDELEINVNGRRIGNTITLKLLGGTADHVTPEGKMVKRTLVVLGNPSLKFNEDVLVFARPSQSPPFTGFFRLIGKSQGKYRIENGIAKRETNGARLVGPRPLKPLDELPIEKLRRAIRQEIQKQNQ